MNKRGVFWPTLAIATIFLLTYALIRIPNLDYSSRLGNNQIALSNAYKDAENDLFYSEQAIKYSLNNASEEFINNGGVDPSCNRIWKFEDANCNPDLKNNFEKLFEEKLKNYGLDPQDIDINNNMIIIKLKDKSYARDLRNFEFNYIVKQEFKQESLIDFNKILKLRNEWDSCTRSTAIECPQSLSKSGDIIYFTIENNKNIFSLSTNGFKKIDFKFGISEKEPRVKVT